MKIIHHEFRPFRELEQKLRQVPLRGFGNPLVYANASITIKQGNPNSLMPPQNYVLASQVENVLEVVDAFEQQHGINALGLNGYLLFWKEGMDPEKEDGIPFLPPIVERTVDDRNGNVIDLINDGMHRVWVARKELNCEISYVHILNVPYQYPYYAYPRKEGWWDVQKIDVLVPGFEKKEYRNPGGNYKDLFRQFNKVFPGVQEARVKTQVHT